MQNPTTKSTGYLYIISCEGTNRIKIGYSGNPEERLKALKTGAPGKLVIEATWSAYQSDETTIHRALRPFRKHLEWFEIDAQEASKTITKTLRRNPTGILKQNDLVTIQTPFTAKWDLVSLENVLMFLMDADIALERMRGYPKIKRDINYGRTAISKMVQCGRPSSTELLNLYSSADTLGARPELYVSTIGRFIAKKTYPLWINIIDSYTSHQQAA